MVRGFKRENPDDPWCLRTSNELRVRKHSSTFLGLTQYPEDKKDAGEGDMKIHWKWRQTHPPPLTLTKFINMLTLRAPQQLRNSSSSTWIHLATAAPSLDQSFSLLSSDLATHPWWMTEAFGPATSQVSRSSWNSWFNRLHFSFRWFQMSCHENNVADVVPSISVI